MPITEWDHYTVRSRDAEASWAFYEQALGLNVRKREGFPVPAFIVSEATLSYVGLGFPDPVASWGTMLHDAANISAFADFPWLLSPAAAMFLVVLGLNLLVQSDAAYTRAMKIG